MKYIERYEDTKRPIRFKDKVKITKGHHEGKIGYVGAKDPDGLPAYNIWFDDGTFDCLMSDEFINAEENIVDLQILKESGMCIEENDVMVRYKDLKDNCIIERWHKYYKTEFGRYIKIKGKRYYIDGKYRYYIDKKGDDFNFSKLRLSYYDSEYGYLVIKPLNELKLKNFQTLFARNGHVLEIYKEILDNLNLWEDPISEIRYGIWKNDIQLWFDDWDEILNFPKVSDKDITIFELLKNKYFEDNDISDNGCCCEYRNGFLLSSEEDYELYDDWAMSVGLA